MTYSKGIRFDIPAKILQNDGIKIGIVSDLHTEFWNSYHAERIGTRVQDQLKEAELILVAGDNGNSGTFDATEPYQGIGIKIISLLFPNKPVCVIAGNHDHYGSSYDETIRGMRWSAENTSNVTFLNRDVYVHGKIRVLGCTLWTDYDFFGTRELSMMRAGLKRFSGARYADFDNIFKTEGYPPIPGYVTPQTLLEWHLTDKEWLLGELDKPFDGATIVMVHHCPVSFGMSPKYVNDDLNPCFASRLENVLLDKKPDIVVWGHTHHSVDMTIDNTRFISSQVGYPVNSSKITETGDFGVIIDVPA